MQKLQPPFPAGALVLYCLASEQRFWGAIFGAGFELLDHAELEAAGAVSERWVMSMVETEVVQPTAQGAAMEITVSRQELVRELTATQSVVERKTTIPILSNFLIEADGERLNITATDLDQAIRTSAAVKVKKPGSCTIPGPQTLRLH